MNKIKYDVYPKNSDRDLFLFPNDDYTLLDKNGREFYKKYLTNCKTSYYIKNSRGSKITTYTLFT